jgi:hypothetical protein
MVERINITVEDEQYERLARMAERMHGRRQARAGETIPLEDLA